MMYQVAVLRGVCAGGSIQRQLEGVRSSRSSSNASNIPVRSLSFKYLDPLGSKPVRAKIFD